MGCTACTKPQCLYKGALYLTFANKNTKWNCCWVSMATLLIFIILLTEIYVDEQCTWSTLLLLHGNNVVIREGKVNVKVKFSLEQATKVQRGSGGIAVLFL